MRLGDAVFPRLTADGYTLAQPKGDWSYHTGHGSSTGSGGTRVDHALATPELTLTDARYLYKAGRHTLAGPATGPTGHGEPLSDHALLSIRLERPRPSAVIRAPATRPALATG